MSSSIRSVIEKNRFKGSDEIIRKAFKIYSEKDLENSMRDFDFEYNDDKIFLKIRYILSLAGCR